MIKVEWRTIPSLRDAYGNTCVLDVSEWRDTSGTPEEAVQAAEAYVQRERGPEPSDVLDAELRQKLLNSRTFKVAFSQQERHFGMLYGAHGDNIHAAVVLKNDGTFFHTTFTSIRATERPAY